MNLIGRNIIKMFDVFKCKKCEMSKYNLSLFVKENQIYLILIFTKVLLGTFMSYQHKYIAKYCNHNITHK